jgi:hypothetical protein
MEENKVGTTTEDVFIGLEDPDPAIVASQLTRQNRPRKFVRNNRYPLPDTEVSIDQVLRELWLTAERHELEARAREIRQRIVQETRAALTNDLILMVNDYLPEYRFQWA